MSGFFFQIPCPVGTLVLRSHGTHKSMTGKQEASRAAHTRLPCRVPGRDVCWRRGWSGRGWGKASLKEVDWKSVSSRKGRNHLQRLGWNLHLTQRNYNKELCGLQSYSEHFSFPLTWSHHFTSGVERALEAAVFDRLSVVAWSSGGQCLTLSP